MRVYDACVCSRVIWVKKLGESQVAPPAPCIQCVSIA